MLVIGLLGVVAVGAGATLAVVLTRSSDDPSPGPSVSTVTRRTTAPQSLRKYTAPGDVCVRLPRGWSFATDLGLPERIREYLAPGGSDTSSDAFIHLGIGNPAPKPDAEDQYRDLLAFLGGEKDTKPRYDDTEVLDSDFPISFGPSAEAYDVEFTGYNDDRVLRHVKERLWLSEYGELIVEIDAPASEWDEYAAVFDELIRLC